MKSPKSSLNENLEILIAEDSPTQAEQLRYLLEENGYSVTVATTGRQALEIASSRPPALVITDIVMPEMDGVQLCKQIKSIAHLKDTPVILLTSLSSMLDVLKGLECGADGFIRKPYEGKNLLARIEYILVNRELRRGQKIGVGFTLDFRGQKHFIDSDRQQILDLLVSTYEEAIHVNEELKTRQGELARSYQSLKALYGLGASLNGSAKVQEVLGRALRGVLELPGVRAAWICLRNEEEKFHLAVCGGLPPGLNIPDAVGDHCPCLKKLLSGEMDQAQNVVECEWLRKAEGVEDLATCHASVPLWSSSRTLGIMNLLSTGGGPFQEEELKILHGVGNQVGIALERAELLEQLEQRVAERTAELVAEIAERGRSEEALRQSEANYRSLVEGAPYGIYRATGEGKLLAVNLALAEMLGYGSEKELMGLNLATDIYLDPAEREQAIQQDTGVKRFRAVEVKWKRKDGRTITVRRSGRPICDERGRTLYVEEIAEDVTDHKLLEEQFRQAQKMEAVGQLAGGVAHDFNNLMGVILGYSDMVLESLTPAEPLHKKVEKIKKAAQRAVGVTRQLLAFSRKQVLQPSVLDLNRTVADMEDMLRRLIGEDIELSTAPGSGLARVKADRGQIEQIIMNLAVNARDAMPRGGKITIETANVELDATYAREHVAVQPGPYVMLAVSDTGIGIDTQTQARIFEPFFTTKAMGKGTGLGLATVYGIVKQSGGYIWVYSEPGQGTSFKVYFPKVEATLSGDDARNVAAPAPRGWETILLVEDEESLRNLAREFLAAKGYTVREAGNGAEALEIAGRGQETIHLMLTDVVMPGMNGRDLARRMERLRPEMKVLYMSGYTDETIVHRGVLEPGMAYLQKPFLPADLARKVREVLDAPKNAERREDSHAA